MINRRPGALARFTMPLPVRAEGMKPHQSTELGRGDASLFADDSPLDPESLPRGNQNQVRAYDKAKEIESAVALLPELGCAPASGKHQDDVPKVSHCCGEGRSP